MPHTDTQEAWLQKQEGDSWVFVSFELYPKEDREASVREGRPVHREVEYVSIRNAGDRDIVRRPVRDADRQRFAQQYSAWKNNTTTEGIVGTPLRAWPPIGRAQVEDLAHFGIRSVEALASLTDDRLKNVGPITQLRQQARDWLAAAKSAAPLTQLRSQVETLEHERELLRKQVEDQAKDLAELKKKLNKPTKE